MPCFSSKTWIVAFGLILAPGSLWVQNSIAAKPAQRTPDTDPAAPAGTLSRCSIPAQISTPGSTVGHADSNGQYLVWEESHSTGTRLMMKNLGADGTFGTPDDQPNQQLMQRSGANPFRAAVSLVGQIAYLEHLNPGAIDPIGTAHAPLARAMDVLWTCTLPGCTIPSGTAPGSQYLLGHQVIQSFSYRRTQATSSPTPDGEVLGMTFNLFTLLYSQISYSSSTQSPGTQSIQAFDLLSGQQGAPLLSENLQPFVWESERLSLSRLDFEAQKLGFTRTSANSSPIQRSYDAALIDLATGASQTYFSDARSPQAGVVSTWAFDLGPVGSPSVLISFHSEENPGGPGLVSAASRLVYRSAFGNTNFVDGLKSRVGELVAARPYPQENRQLVLSTLREELEALPGKVQILSYDPKPNAFAVREELRPLAGAAAGSTEDQKLIDVEERNIVVQAGVRLGIAVCR